MSPLIYIGLFIMLVTIVSEFVFLVNYLYIKFIKRQPAKVQKKLFITFGVMMCGFVIFLLGTQKVFSSKEVASFEIQTQTIDEQPVDVVPDNTTTDTNDIVTETPWYDKILSQENKDAFDQLLNDTGQVVDEVITSIGEGISQLTN